MQLKTVQQLCLEGTSHVGGNLENGRWSSFEGSLRSLFPFARWFDRGSACPTTVSPEGMISGGDTNDVPALAPPADAISNYQR